MSTLSSNYILITLSWLPFLSFTLFYIQRKNMSPYSRTPVKGRTKSALIKGSPWRSSKRTWRAGGSSGEWTADEWKILAVDELSERNRKFPEWTRPQRTVRLLAVIWVLWSRWWSPADLLWIMAVRRNRWHMTHSTDQSCVLPVSFFFWWVCVSCLSVCTHSCVVYPAFVSNKHTHYASLNGPFFCICLKLCVW